MTKRPPPSQTLGRQLHDRLGAPLPPPAKRPRTAADAPSYSIPPSVDEGEPPSYSAAPRPRSPSTSHSSRGPEVQLGVGVREDADAEDDAHASDYRALDVTADRALQKELHWQLAQQRFMRQGGGPGGATTLHWRARCFLCQYGQRDYDATADLGCQAYVAMIRYLEAHIGHEEPAAIACEVANLYLVHYYGPACRENGGVPPPDVGEFTPVDVLRHMKKCMNHPVLNQIFVMEKLRDTATVLSERLVHRSAEANDTRPIDSFTRVLKEFAKENARWAKMIQERGARPEIELDPQALAAAGPLRRVAPLLVQRQEGGARAPGDGLAAPRPVFATPAVDAQRRAQEDEEIRQLFYEDDEPVPERENSAVRPVRADAPSTSGVD